MERKKQEMYKYHIRNVRLLHPQKVVFPIQKARVNQNAHPEVRSGQTTNITLEIQVRNIAFFVLKKH